MRKGTWTWGALVLTACLGLASGEGRAQDASTNEQVVTRGMHLQIDLPEQISRIAVGDPSTASAEILDSKSVLVLGQKTGRTSLLVWLESGKLQKFVLSVETDLTLLREALAQIHESITADVAPDREAIVLRGDVPDSTFRAAAEQAASAYLFASSAPRKGRPVPLMGTEDGAAGELRVDASGEVSGSVINLIRIDELPDEIDDRISSAISESGIAGVRVRRLRRGDIVDDAADVLVLEGAVANQVQLTRVLHLASTMFLGKDLDLADVRATDESGGLLDGLSGNSGGTDTPASAVTSSSSSGNFTSSNNTDSFDNQIGRNIARAKVVSIGDGRILSFLDVRDLPQIRIDVRLYEVNKTDLLQYAPDFALLFSDFDQPNLLPSSIGTATQGLDAARVGSFSGSADVQGAMAFLADGFTQNFQVSGSHVALDAAFRVLESKGIARSLSGPSLTVLSGEQARFLVGGEIPVPESFSPAFGGTDANAAGVFNSVDFKTFGVELAIRPLAGDDDRITLDVLSQVSRPAPELTQLVRDSTGTDPTTTAFDTRSIGTSARVLDGGSLLMGGLMQRRSTDSSSSTPLLSEIPGIGWMFKRFSVQDEDFELVIMVSPVLVRSPIDDLSTWEFPELAEIFLQPPEFWVDQDAKVLGTETPAAESEPAEEN